MRNDKCDRRLFCDDYKYYHCDGCNGNEKSLQGKWIQYRKGHYIGVKCSECDTIQDYTTNYCPKCGAHNMRGG